MKIRPRSSLFLAIIASFVSATAQALPPEGRYIGIVRITKFLPLERGLTTRTTNRIVAQVYANGALTIMSVVPETPFAAFDTGSTVIQGVLKADGTCNIKGPPFNPRAAVDPANLNDYAGTVAETDRGFTIRHENTPIGVSYLIQPPTTTFEYTLRRANP